MADREYEKLLSGERVSPVKEFHDDPSEANMQTTDEAADSHTEGTKSTPKRERLQRSGGLEKVEEVPAKSETESTPQAPRKSSCPVDYWGVKSYLHNFYETHFYKDPSVYEDEEDQHYLLNPNPRRTRCKSIWWKVFVWIGANFLIFGIIGVLIGYLVPERRVVALSTTHQEVIDTNAVRFNYNLDICKLVGLILFCTGGIILTVALLFPSFLYHLCEEDRRIDGAFKVSMFSEEKPVKHPLEKSIPVTSKLSNVQPVRKLQEALASQEGMVEYKD